MLAYKAVSLSKKKLYWDLKKHLKMEIYAILIVGAASSRDHGHGSSFSRLEVAPTRN